MRFITEFEVHPCVLDCTKSYRDYASEKMNVLESRLGNQIAIAFHWDVPKKMGAGKYKLEIEAFPMDKWVEFKNRLLTHIDFCNGEDSPVDEIRVLSIIKELESFGKNPDR